MGRRKDVRETKRRKVDVKKEQGNYKFLACSLSQVKSWSTKLGSPSTEISVCKTVVALDTSHFDYHLNLRTTSETPLLYVVCSCDGSISEHGHSLIRNFCQKT